MSHINTTDLPQMRWAENRAQSGRSQYQRFEDAQLHHRIGAEMKTHLPHWMGANFSGDVFNYFAFLRGAGYFFDAMYAPLVFYFMGVDYKDRHRINIDRGVHRRSDAARASMNSIEACSFMGLAGVAAFTQLNMMRKQMANAVAAESGISEDKVGYLDFRRSENPLVESAMDFFQWNNVFRVGTSAFFFHSLQAGILAKIVDITLQRTLFSEGPAYEAVEHLVNDVHEGNLGERLTEDTVNDMVRILQRVQREHDRQPYSKEVIAQWIPALTDLAHAMEKYNAVGMAEVVHALGGGVLVEGDGEKSQANMRHMLELGMKGLVAERQGKPLNWIEGGKDQGVVKQQEKFMAAA